MVDLRPATVDDIWWVASRLRAADLAELQALHGTGVDVQRVLWRAVRVSDIGMAAIAPGGEPIALCGVAPVSLVSGEGSPWMLGTDQVERQARAAVVIGRHLVTEWAQQYRLLQNWVDARNRVSVRWLARIGFTIHPAEPYGAQHLPFHRFSRCA